MEFYMKREWKRFLLLAFTFMLLSVGCGKNEESTNTHLPEGKSDLEYIQSKGTLVAGITDFAPMDYRDGEEWTGFDLELAKNFAKSIGVTLEPKEIDWDDKISLLEKGEIDCIWNGMTMTNELKETISCSTPYLSNEQVVVMYEDELGRHKSIEDCQHLLFAVESGSTGENILKEKKYRYTTCATQKEALQNVLDKKADATVIDIIMAAYNTGTGQEYDKLGFAVSLNDEKICVGFRKNSDLTRKADAFIQASYEDGSISKMAEKYGIDNAVLK